MPGSPKKPPAVRRGPNGTQDVQLREDAPETPACPRGLLKRTRERWESYWSSDVARAVDPIADLHCVERWIVALDEYERVYPKVRRQRTIDTMQGVVLHPLARYLVSVQRELRSAEAELGLTPMARLKLGITFQEARRTLPVAKRDAEQTTTEQDDPRRVLLGVG